MSRSAELQIIVQNKMEALGLTAYADEAPDGAIYPYVVYSIDSFSYEDARDDIVLDCDVWDQSPNYAAVEDIADKIEMGFDKYSHHSEDSTVLPIFFRYVRNKVPDTDHKLKRINIKFEIQNYLHKIHAEG